MKMLTKVEHLGKQAETPQNEGNTGFKESSIYKTLRPNFLFLSIFGMYYERHMKARGKVGGITPGMVYSGVVLMMMTANCLRFLAAFKVGEPFSEVLMMKIVFEVWFVQGAASVFVFFNACRNGSFIELLTAWKACKDSNPCNDKGTSSVLLKVVLFGISVLVVMMNVTMLGIIMFSQGISKISDYAYLMYSPFPNDGGAGEMIGKVMCLMVHALNSVAWIVPINLFYLLCNLLTYEFKLFNQALDDHVDDNGVLKGDMERFRKWHYSLTCLTGMLNDTFSTFTACTYITNFPLAVMILYMLVWPSERDLLYTVFTCIWLGADLFHMCMVTYAGGTLVSHTHAGVDTVHRISLENLQSEQRSQVLMLERRLSGAAIGIGVYELFMIDHTVLLSIPGMLLTYFLLLIDYSGGSQSAIAVATNATNLTSA